MVLARRWAGTLGRYLDTTLKVHTGTCLFKICSVVHHQIPQTVVRASTSIIPAASRDRKKRIKLTVQLY